MTAYLRLGTNNMDFRQGECLSHCFSMTYNLSGGVKHHSLTFLLSLPFVTNHIFIFIPYSMRALSVCLLAIVVT